MFNIGPYQVPNRLVLAPMAGISDRPFRTICKEQGAGLTVSEMIAANPDLREHKKTLLKADHEGEPGLNSVQIVGTEPSVMAEAARYNVRGGAKIIDINMGCPAKKVCAVSAGSALMKDPALVKKILESVVDAVDVPVTLKIRTGWDKHSRNAVEIAQIAENAGIAALAVHGRTRACKFEGEAEYETIKQVKQAVKIPVIANGDIDTPEKACQVLQTTGADAIMIGRAAHGNPWVFKQIEHFAKFGERLASPAKNEVFDALVKHLESLYSFYGNVVGVRIARKHIGWYLRRLDFVKQDNMAKINLAEQPDQQMQLVQTVFSL